MAGSFKDFLDSKKTGEDKKAAKDEAPPAYNMSGEAGRMARKQARDCMNGRFRP